MNFTGTYKLVSQTNFDIFMKKIGVPDPMIEKMKDVKSTTAIKQEGDNYDITVTTGDKIIANTFTIGEETEFKLPTGQTVTTTPRRDGNKICMKLNAFDYVTECTGNKLKTIMTLGDTVYTRVSERVSNKAV